MADGYARTTGQIGVCSVTCGPGLTNAATSLATAARHGSKLLLLAGDVGVGDRRNVQNIDQQRLIETLGARCLVATSARSAVVELAAAFRHIESRLGVAVLDLPVDVQRRSVDPLAPPPGWRTPPRLLVEPDPEAIQEAAELLVAADRPALLVGRGGIAAGAAVLRLGERLGAPVITTLRAKGLGHGHPLVAGVSGALGDGAAEDALRSADVICVLEEPGSIPGPRPVGRCSTERAM